jgi:protein-tyrosine-phosphatase/DNA-binding transcriptional ArsR family regulator
VAADRADLSPPGFLRLAGHPVRWRLLRELARTDLQVRELTGLLGQPQSLVSYHLGQLRAGQVVSMRRSSADGRDAYYSLNLPRCGELLAGAGAALHPGLRLVPPPDERPGRRAAPAARVLFLCTGNGARSQIAEALLETLAAGTVTAVSAGSHPTALHPNAVRVMRTRGIDLRGRRAKHLNEFTGQHFDHVITLCDRVREVCPDFSGHPSLIHWSFPDPAGEGDSDEETYPAFQRFAADVEIRIRFLLHLIDHPSRKETTDHAR